MQESEKKESLFLRLKNLIREYEDLKNDISDVVWNAADFGEHLHDVVNEITEIAKQHEKEER